MMYGDGFYECPGAENINLFSFFGRIGFPFELKFPQKKYSFNEMTIKTGCFFLYLPFAQHR
ncbi:hypothetical protein NIES592_03840 [Fischerella major NIES-592]|uniref:Uncharacterized protein n=1 Tax=Fischerella major NIES-592 TaxID=210994 RepID=A0A1U7H687_9CYAN|nr:hypothetical protein NIES592_03840 [Fischerella major NIES-592]